MVGTVDGGVPARARFPRLHRIPLLVFVVGLLVTAVLAFAAREVHDNNEDHLLRERVNEAAAVISVAASSVQAPLSSAAILAEGTNANTTRFLGPHAAVGVGNSAPFVSASIWPAQSSSPRPLFVVGARPELADCRRPTFAPSLRRRPRSRRWRSSTCWARSRGASVRRQHRAQSALRGVRGGGPPRESTGDRRLQRGVLRYRLHDLSRRTPAPARSWRRARVPRTCPGEPPPPMSRSATQTAPRVDPAARARG